MAAVGKLRNFEMAELCSFDEANTVLDKPSDMTYGQCQAASVLRAVQHNGQPVVISCWKLTQEELDEINRTGRVWLGVLGITMPPSYIAGIRPF